MRLIMNNVERIAETEAQIRKLKSSGYEPLEMAGPTEDGLKAESGEKPELEKMKANELKSLAKEKGIEGAASLTKEELLAVLKDVI